MSRTLFHIPAATPLDVAPIVPDGQNLVWRTTVTKRPLTLAGWKSDEPDSMAHFEFAGHILRISRRLIKAVKEPK